MSKLFIYLILLIVFIFTFSCKQELVAPNEIQISGDYTGKLNNIWSPNNQPLSFIVSSFADSSNIGYPSFLLDLQFRNGAFYVREAADQPLIKYFVIDHGVDISNANQLELKDLKLVQGTAIINNVITNMDDSKSVILNGKITR